MLQEYSIPTGRSVVMYDRPYFSTRDMPINSISHDTINRSHNFFFFFFSFFDMMHPQKDV